MSSSRIAKNTKIAFIDRISMAFKFTNCLARRICVQGGTPESAVASKLKCLKATADSGEPPCSFRLGTKIRMLEIHNEKLHFILAHFQSPSKIQNISIFYLYFAFS